MLSQCTPKSLCLIDEFGKGTASVDGSSSYVHGLIDEGMALLAAIIHHFLQHRTRTFIILHFYEVGD